LKKSYVETIAGQWKRSGIETASEAMDIAEKEHKKKFKNTTNKKQVVPSWFNESVKSSDNNEEEDKEFKNFIEEFRK
jgi:replication initiation and membrane attachment protein DnaB